MTPKYFFFTFIACLLLGLTSFFTVTGFFGPKSKEPTIKIRYIQDNKEQEVDLPNTK